MNEIVSQFLLAGDKFMPEMHLTKPEFIIYLMDHLPKAKKKSKNLKKLKIQVKLEKRNQIKLAFNMHDMAYRDFRDFPRRTACENILRDKAFNIAKIQIMMDIKEVLLQWL